MWIFEVITKFAIKKIQQHNSKQIKEIEKIECEHTFLPVDSTKKLLACSKCGMLIKRENLKPKIVDNVFNKPDF